MKAFKVRKGNFIKSNNNTRKMMYHLIISLVPIMLFAFYKNGILPIIKGYGNLIDVLKPILLLVVPSVVCLFVEYIYFIVKKDKKSFQYLIEESFAIIPGIFIGLIIPLNTPIWLVIIAALIASFSKMIFGGLGKNVLNPALTGTLIITIFLSSYIGSLGGYLNSYEIDAISGATPLANLSANSYAGTYEELVGTYGNLWSFFFGNIPGSVGETSAFLCIAAFAYLTVNKVIKWRIPVFYVLTVFVMSAIIGFNNNMGLWYPIFCILSGSVLFGAVFMTTDPVTTPIVKHSQVLGGIILGILTVSIRYLTNYPEGVLISILILNILTIFINKLSIKFSFSKIYKIASIVLLVVIALFVSIIISNKIDYNPNSNDDPNFQVTNTEKNGENIIYYVTSRGYTGKQSLKSKVTMKEDTIINLEIISNKESYFHMIEDANFLEKIINNQNDLDSVEAVSGATYTSDYLKKIIEKIKIYNKNNK